MKRYEFSEEQRALMEGMQIPFAVYQFLDRRVVTLVLSEGFCKLFGYDDPAQAYYDMDHDMYKDTHPDDAARIADAAFRFATQGGVYEVIYRTKKHAASGYTIVHAKGEHIFTPDGVRLAHVWYTDEGAYAENVDQSLRLNNAMNRALHVESLLQASHYDSLTGLPGMTYFFELAEAGKAVIIARGETPMMLFFDLNGMKFYNRKYGFGAGDKLLRAFSKLLVRYFSNENCARFGQDHFAVFTTETGLDERLRRLLDEAAAINDGDTLPVRVGVYRSGTEDVDVSTACDLAKTACDTIRSDYGSNIHYYDESLRDQLRQRRYVVENLDRAMREHWIEVHFQPIVRAVNGRVCDEEALARWNDPERGLLSPAQFIPYLEDAGLIYKLDLHVLDLTLEKLQFQKRAGLFQVPQSINLSRADFDSCDIVEEIRRRVDDSGMERSLITIEITESVIGSDLNFMRGQIERFRALGFQVWMDDFGSGYSSLDALQSIDFDLIKFDQRFMQEFNQGERGRIILTELVKMAHALHVETVCEGVETAEQVRFLQEIGCAKLQGYYYCKPISPQAILERYRKGVQIGFEDPAETKYFEAIGKINLYDLAVVAQTDDPSFHNFFNTVPMAILELQDGQVRFARTNQSYREFMRRRFHFNLLDEPEGYTDTPTGSGAAFMGLVRQCCQSGSRAFIDEQLPDGSTVHSFARRLSVNPVTGAVAVAAAVLSILDAEEGTTYASLARAMAADYNNLFYVDLDTEHFVEYRSEVGEEAILAARHGENFFATARRDAQSLLYPADRMGFIAAFSKESVVEAIREQGTFTLTYRLLQNGQPVWTNMKAMPMRQKGNYIIIGISNVDAQLRQKEALDRIRREQAVFSRIIALTGDYLCLYTVEKDAGRYVEFSATADFTGFQLPKTGEDFFSTARKNAAWAIYPADLPLFMERFTRENVKAEIEKSGLFQLDYRLMLSGKPVPVKLRAAIVRESEGEKLIVGIHRSHDPKEEG